MPRADRISLMTTLEAIDEGIAEAEQIRARHDGVHLVHNYVCTLMLLRDFAQSSHWGAREAECFDQTMLRVRQIDRSGFCERKAESVP